MSAARITELWRYPVKAMAGERLEHAVVVGGQLEGDRAWGVFDRDAQTLLSAKRLPALLEARARWRGAPGAGVVEIELPTGQVAVAGEPAADAALSAWLGRPVALRQPTPEQASTIEMDVLDDTGEVARIGSFQTRPGSRFDSRSPLHLLNAATGRQLDAEHGPGAGDPRRYRPNVVIDGAAALDELAWVEGRVALGGLTAWVRTRTERCVVITRAQPGVPADRALLRHVAARHEVCVGVYLHPDGDGPIAVGDAVGPAEPT
ncbi:MAG: MOSC N-terminal beta barrel domain-containing protein [Kofleriaceae bacterium]